MIKARRHLVLYKISSLYISVLPLWFTNAVAPLGEVFVEVLYAFTDRFSTAANCRPTVAFSVGLKYLFDALFPTWKLKPANHSVYIHLL